MTKATSALASPTSGSSTASAGFQLNNNTSFPGLWNAGNTCYVNSCLQILKYCPGFASTLNTLPNLTQRPQNPVPSKSSPSAPARYLVTEELKSLFHDVDKSIGSKNLNPLSASNFLRAVSAIDRRFSAKGQQQDAQEFMRLLIDVIREGHNDFHALQIAPSEAWSSASSSPTRGDDPNMMDIDSLESAVVDIVDEKSSVSEESEGTTKRKRKREISPVWLAFDDMDVSMEESGGNGGEAPEEDKVEASAKRQKLRESNHIFITLVESLFQGSMRSSIRCLECDNRVAFRDEPFLDLSVTIEKRKSITWSLNQFTSRSVLRGADKYRCETCMTLSEAVREVKFSRLPDILCLHLKRFKWNSVRMKLEKITDQMTTPNEFDLSASLQVPMSPDQHYELFGLIVHSGSSPFSGHYIALVKAKFAFQANPTEVTQNLLQKPSLDAWIRFDDDQVVYVDNRDVQDLLANPLTKSLHTPYMLFYSRVSTSAAKVK